jgi:hypothetical protein
MKVREEQNDSHLTIKISCCCLQDATTNHTLPHDDQRRKYAEVEYGKYAKDSMYIDKGVCIAKGKYI